MNREQKGLNVNIKSVRERLQTTLSNIQWERGGTTYNNIEHCIEVLKILEKETTPIIKDNCFKCGENITYTDEFSFCPVCLTHQ